MRYIIKDKKIKDTTTNLTVAKLPNNMYYSDNYIMHNRKENKYYLASVLYLFNKTDEEITEEIELVYNESLYCLVEVYLLPSMQFIGFVGPIKYTDLRISKNTIINYRNNIAYIPTVNGFVRQQI